MAYFSQIAFLLALSIAGYFLYKSIKRISGNIKLGKANNLSDNKPLRFKQMALLALGQKKMFSRPIPAILHMFIYVGFIIVNLEVLEIILDGILGTHRLFAPILGGFYGVLINVFEFFAVSVFVACVFFLFRRDLVKLPRFNKPEMKGWPTIDAHVILLFEIALMSAFLKMDACDQILQGRGVAGYHHVGPLLFSGVLVSVLNGFSTGTLIVLERICWWFHILGIMVFANYVPYSKHLHIFMAFLNSYFARLMPAGELANMPAVTNEVKLMLGLPTDPAATTPSNEPLRFGARDAHELTWDKLLGAYACTECGRCTSVCPANLTGKKLSPRKIMMDTRDRIEEIGLNIEKNGSFVDDGKALYSDQYISTEELLACTTCNACTDACPININPLDIIIDLRRFMIMEESKAPASWNGMFSNMETSFAPWKFSPSDRFNWSQKLND